MNPKQRILFAVVALVFAGMLLCPPWIYSDATSAGYTLIFSPPEKTVTIYLPNGPVSTLVHAEIDWRRLRLQLAATLAVGIAVALLFGATRSRPAPAPGPS